jgi:benzodiazapine receptor
MGPKFNALLNALGLILVIAVNALANILPINGLNTGQISGFYPNYFVPAGFTFGIWGIIYVLLIGFVITSFAVAFGKPQDNLINLLQDISFPFQITCLLNAGWILAWHYLQLGFSIMIMIALLVFLAKIFLRTQNHTTPASKAFAFWLHQPFFVYLGWISVATIANFTALFVGIGWQGGWMSPVLWSIMMICIAFILGSYFIIRYRTFAYAFVLAWAFFGIYSKQITDSKVIGYTALFASSALLALIISSAIRKRQLAKQ